MRYSSYTVNEFVCPCCGNKMYVPRQKANKRKKGHKKYLWCPYCQKVQNFDEVNNGMYIRDGNGDPIER